MSASEERDAVILQPIRVAASSGNGYWQPLTGEVTGDSVAQINDPGQYGLKRTKGRTRQMLSKKRSH